MSDIIKAQLSYQDQETLLLRVESPSGEYERSVPPPFSTPAVRAILAILESPGAAHFGFESSQVQALRDLGIIQGDRLLGAQACNRIIGQRLFDLLFPTDPIRERNIRSVLDAAVVAASKTEDAVHVQLRFDAGSVDLAELPWELIYDHDEHLVASGRVCLTRYITFGQATQRFPVSNRIKVLLVASRPEDLQALDPEAEASAIRKAFNNLGRGDCLRLKILQPPTLDAMIDELNAHSYHVVHFDGHGAFGRRCPCCEQFQWHDSVLCSTPGCGARLDNAEQQGCLAFERSAQDRRAHLVSAQELGTVLCNRSVRLFFASACRSGRMGGASVFSAVGPRLILSGVPAALAMQCSISAKSAAAFIDQFYAALARGESISEATTAGRRMLYTRGTWHIPALYLRSQDHEGRLFSFLGEDSQRRLVAHRDGLGNGLYLAHGAVDWAGIRPAEAAPYKLLDPYQVEDRSVFYGREQLTRQLVSEVLQHRLAIAGVHRG